MAMLIRSRKDFWTGVLFTAAGLSAIIIGRDYPMGSATKMGPAFFPSVLGAVLAVIGLAAVIRSLKQTAEPLGGLAYKQAVLVLAATVLFGVLVRGTGLVISVIVLVLVSAWGSQNFRWRHSITLAVGLAGFSVLVFVKALGLPLPALGAWFSG
jgi:Tripartite tricarboxylate transporter TctB family